MVCLNVAKDEKLNHGNCSKWDNYCEKQSIYTIVCVANVGEDIITGWKPSSSKYLTGVQYENSSGTFHIEQSGVYQVREQPPGLSVKRDILLIILNFVVEFVKLFFVQNKW